MNVSPPRRHCRTPRCPGMRRFGPPLAAFQSVLTVLCLIALGGCTMTLDDDTFLHPQSRVGSPTSSLRQAIPRATVSEETLAVGGGVGLRAIRVSPPAPIATVLYLGGNGFMTLLHGKAVARAFDRLDLEVVMFDYRGYGESEGVPTLAVLRADALEVFDAVAGKAGGSTRVIVHGQSLGSFLAAQIAEERKVGGLVLESTATTPAEWADSQIPRIARGLVRVEIADALEGISNLSVVERLDEALVLIVGGQDRTTPPLMSRALLDAAKVPSGCKSLHVIPGRGHNDAFLSGSADAAYGWLLGSGSTCGVGWQHGAGVVHSDTPR